MKLSIHALGLLLAGTTMATAQNFAVTGLNPARNAPAALRAANVSVTFSQPPSAASVSALRVFSSQRGGLLAGTASVSGNTLSFDPTRDLRPGETVQAILTTAAQSTGGSALAAAQVFQFTAAAQGGTGVFGGTTDVPVGANPLNVVPADIDNDGDLDLLTSNIARNTVSVRLNDGHGQFSGSLNVPVDNSPFWLAVADIDADGDLDFLTANTSTPTVSVRLNNGAGAFTAGTPISVPGSSYHLSLADLEGDGDLDLLIARSVGNVGVSVRLNDGNGIFSGGRDLDIGTNPWWVAAADIDADGDQDLLVADFEQQQGKVSVRYNNGNGIFLGGYDLPLGIMLSSLATADLDRDGDLDLLIVDSGSSRVWVRLNNGTGIFTGSAFVAVGALPRTVTPADLDGDGDLDIVVSNQGDNTLGIHLNNGTGAFGVGRLVGVGREPLGTAAADMDGDGDLDVVVANVSSNFVSALFNNGTGTPLTTAGRRTVDALLVAPNPAREVVRVLLPAGARQVVVINSLGQHVRTLPVAPAATEVSVDVRGLPAGVYVVQAGVASSRLLVE